MNDQLKKPVEPEFGWYGAGYACFKGDRLVPGFFPPLDDEPALFEWFEGFGAAHADDLDDEIIAGTLAGDFACGESFDDALFRILKFRIYDCLETAGTFERYRKHTDK